MISANELETAMRKSGYDYSADEMHKMISNIDYAGNGKINYSEFLAASISIKNVLTYDKLWALFKHFDTDDSGMITPENIREAFNKAGKHLTDEDLKSILENHDIEKNGKISFDEFKMMFVDAGDVTLSGSMNLGSEKLSI